MEFTMLSSGHSLEPPSVRVHFMHRSATDPHTWSLSLPYRASLFQLQGPASRGLLLHELCSLLSPASIQLPWKACYWWLLCCLLSSSWLPAIIQSTPWVLHGSSLWALWHSSSSLPPCAIARAFGSAAPVGLFLSFPWSIVLHLQLSYWMPSSTTHICQTCLQFSAIASGHAFLPSYCFFLELHPVKFHGELVCLLSITINIANAMAYNLLLQIFFVIPCCFFLVIVHHSRC